jgi:glyoxylase-like metal-dependent hydrolase (beta-lactamase superfamily II)
MLELESGLTRRQLLAAVAAATATRLLSKYIPAAEHPVTAPKLGAFQQGYYRFALGDFEVTTISDAGAFIDGPWPIVGENQPPADVARLMNDNLLPETKFQPGFTPTLVNTGKQLILFDTGNGSNGFVPRPNGGWLASQLGPAGFNADQIDIVVLTHGHTDHIGGLMEGGKPLFPNARYAIGGSEYEFWSSKARFSAPADGNEYKSAKLFRATVMPMANRITFLKPNEEVVSGIRAVSAYGHTPGHLAFHVESNGRQLLLWGDCAHHEVASLARPEWHAFFDMDKEEGAATRKRIYAMVAAERMPVIGYHTSFPSVGFVEKASVGYRWLPVTYQFRV